MRTSFAALLLSAAAVSGDPPVLPLKAGAPNDALEALLRGALAKDGSPSPLPGLASLLAMPSPLSRLQPPLGGSAPKAAAPSDCPATATAMNAAADLMRILRRPDAQRRVAELAQDERAVGWVVERVRESIADPDRFFGLMANQMTANMLSAVSAKPELLQPARCAKPEGGARGHGGGDSSSSSAAPSNSSESAQNSTGPAPTGNNTTR